MFNLFDLAVALHKNKIRKKISLTLIGLIFLFSVSAQCPTNIEINKNIEATLKNSLLSGGSKLQLFYELKKQTDQCKLTKDSVYAKLLYILGLYEYISNKNYSKSIEYTLESIKVNYLPQKSSSKAATIKSYINLGYYYRYIFQYTQSLACCDSAIEIGEQFHLAPTLILEAKTSKAHIYFLTGDFQKCIEESTKGIELAQQEEDNYYHIEFLIQRSNALFVQRKTAASLADIETVFKNTNDPFNLASASRIKAKIYESNGSFKLANTYYIQSVNYRIKSNDYALIADDYVDLGSLYFNRLKDPAKAKRSYNSAIEFAKKAQNFTSIALIYINLGNLNLADQNYSEAREYYYKTFQTLKIPQGKNILENPVAAIFNTIGYTELITELLSRKVLLLLELYKQTKEKKYIDAGIQTALLTDSVITQKRHQQLGEQSKLYWRNQTRDFFTNAIEACLLANDSRNAFYFMEKSKSVLLNDKLNELGASAKISEADAQKEQFLKIRILEEQQKLNELTANTGPYNAQEQKFLKVKEELETYIKSLEAKYPAYYNYKYADAVPTLESLQKHLAVNKKSFIHYFTNDTVAYILSITATDTRFIKLLKKDFNDEQIVEFLQYSSNRELLNTRYPSFAAVSNKLYKTLFQSLQLPKGRVVICSDNFILPFEALCTDAAGRNFLIRDYTFSYAYSATNLLKPYNAYEAMGNFIGFAPVSFQPALRVNTLLNSASALNKSADNYSSSLLFTNTTATKSNFINNIGGYTIANIFSHASADSSENEPRLYMQDGVIHLSELQLLNKPATRLVVLSACQTNVGKNATGEGIYSLARGFSAAGIPSIAATLWNADEDVIYAISAKFHEYLSRGMSKDSALQKAKLDVLTTNLNSEKSLPYYWANMILIGNTESLELSADSNRWWWITGIAVAILVLTILIVIKHRSGKSR